MPTVFDLDGARGKGAIYTVDSVTPNDDAPLTNPRANLSRLHWHSDFDYVQMARPVVQLSVTIPSVAKNTRRFATTNLVAHGQTGIPVVFAAANFANSGWCPLHVGCPLESINPDGSFASNSEPRRLISIGATATWIILRDCSWGFYSAGTAAFTLPALTFDIRVFITNKVI